MGDDPNAANPEQNLAIRLAKDYPGSAQHMLEAFRAAVSGLPHKAGTYAALCGHVALIEQGNSGGIVLDALLRTVVHSLNEALKDFCWWEIMTLVGTSNDSNSTASSLTLVFLVASSERTRKCQSGHAGRSCYCLGDDAGTFGQCRALCRLVCLHGAGFFAFGRKISLGSGRSCGGGHVGAIGRLLFQPATGRKGFGGVCYHGGHGCPVRTLQHGRSLQGNGLGHFFPAVGG